MWKKERERKKGWKKKTGGKVSMIWQKEGGQGCSKEKSFKKKKKPIKEARDRQKLKKERLKEIIREKKKLLNIYHLRNPIKFPC